MSNTTGGEAPTQPPSDLERILLAVNSDHENDVMDELLERAGLRWTCRDYGHTWTSTEGEACGICGRTA